MKDEKRLKDVKPLKDDDLEKVTGGTGLELEEEKPLEVDLPWWWKPTTEENEKPGIMDDPFESTINFFSDEGTPGW